MFTIILPTHNRPELVIRSIYSVISQSNKDWRLIIVIDDTISDYSAAKKIATDNSQITIIENESNIGKNASLNVALDLLQSQEYQGHIIFLDDDDWLGENCLEKFYATKDEPWIVSNRYNITTKRALTHNRTGRNTINYLRDMLLLRRFSGETTQCISFPRVYDVRFPTTIKNAEEWLYYSSVAKNIGTFLYIPFEGTLTDGYLSEGLTRKKKKPSETLILLAKVCRESWHRGILYPSCVAYLILRTVKTLLFR